VSVRTYPARRYRARPAPRRRTRRGRPATRVDWDRLGRIALVLVLFAVLLSYLGPTLHLAGTWRDSRGERQHVTDLKRENADLRRRAAALKDPDAVEREARGLGMVSSGERPYVVRGLPGD
jgi:cell division protein FtsB